MKRRAFLGFLGGAAAAGPWAAKSAAQMGLSDLALPGIARGGEIQALDKSPLDAKEYAKSGLARLLGKSAAQIERERRETYVDGLDPDIASLRSVAIGAKVRWQKQTNYDKRRRMDEERYRGILADWWE